MPTYTIDRDADLFARQSDRTRHLIQRRLRALRKVAGARSVAAGIRAARADFAGEPGFSAGRMYALHKAYAASGDWKCLVNRALAGPRWRSGGAGTLPGAFLDYVASEWALRQRDKFAAVHQALGRQLERWRRGDEAARIPGYAAPPEPSGTDGLPRGWSYDNLHRLAKARVSKFSRKLVQVGPKAAHLAEAPHVLATRAGLAPGEYFLVDDSWNDFKVLAFGQTVRLLSYHILDLASGCNVKRGYKPALTDERNVEERLREREMIWLWTAQLQQIGYREAGTIYICEKATGTIRPEEEAIVRDFGLNIQVQRGPRGGGPGIDGLFTGPGGGNPHWKAPLESWFNLLRNRTDHLLEFPGQTGSYSSGLPMPECLAGLERDTKALLDAARALPLTRAEMLQAGLLNYQDAIFALERVTELINWRIDHQLEGWRQCGHVVVEWRPHESARWLPAAELVGEKYSPAERAAFAALLAANARLKRERNLSPAEVWQAGAARLKKIPLALAALLMAQIPPAGNEAECVVERGVLAVRQRELDPDAPLFYGLTRRDGNGGEEPLRTGEKYLVRVNGCDPSLAYLYKANGEFAGAANYHGRESRDEIQANHRQFAAKRQWLAEETGDARFLASRLTRADIQRAAHNADVLRGVAAEKAGAERLAREAILQG